MLRASRRARVELPCSVQSEGLLDGPTGRADSNPVLKSRVSSSPSVRSLSTGRCIHMIGDSQSQSRFSGLYRVVLASAEGALMNLRLPIANVHMGRAQDPGFMRCL